MIPKSLTPKNIGAVTLKNRFLFPSMCNFYCDEQGYVTPQLMAYVEARARGGAAAIIMPGSPHGAPGPARPALSAPAYYPGWKALRDICHAHDCRLFVQIHPAKAQAGRGGEVLLPADMDIAFIEETVQSYARCAKAAREIGLDGVEIHGAHAHEIAQFLSPFYNRREDAYGGDVIRRSKLGQEVIRAIKRAAGEDFPLIFRLSSDEYINGGRTIEETLELAPLLERAGADALHVSVGMPLSDAYISAPMDVPDMFNLPDIERVKQAAGIPVIAVGRIRTPEQAERIISEGRADFVAVGRGMLADADFVKKAESGRSVRACIGCNQGCRKSITQKAIFCTQNPFTGREAALRLAQDASLSTQRILVIGAGVCGLETAIDLARRGARPEIWERQAQAGGLIRLAKLSPHKAGMEAVIADRLRTARDMDIPIRFAKEATVEAVKGWGPDLVVLATGSEPQVPDIPGLLDGKGALMPGIHTADAVLSMADANAGKAPGRLGRRVAVLGGGLVGVEVADWLCAQGISVDVFEMGERVGAGLNKNRLHFIKARLRDGHVGVHENTRITSVAFPSLYGETPAGSRSYDGYDAMIIALGRKSVNGLAEALRAALPAVNVVTLGDAAKPGMVLDAVAAAAVFADTYAV